MNKNEFHEYIEENYNVSEETKRFINNVLNFVENNYFDEYEQHEVIAELLNGVVGLTNNEINKVYL